MNKILHINMGGYPFSIDEDAHAYLEQYLDTISRHFQGADGQEEIMSDIENRMAELLQERLITRKILSVDDIRAVISIMGRPEDFGAEPLDTSGYDTGGYQKDTTDSKSSIKTGKRLYRNPDDKVVSGVCSGIAAYFGIKDPIWIRLAFALLAIGGGGSSIPVYFVLMFLMPVARTAKEKLEMRGEPINVENLAKTVESEIKTFSNQFKGFGKKNEQEGTGQDTNHAFRESIQEGVSFLSRTLRALGETLGQILRPVLLAFGGILVVVFIALWTAAILGFFKFKPLLLMLLPGSSMLSILAVMNIFFILGTIIAGIVILVMRLFFRIRVARTWTAGLWIFWAINLVSLGVIVSSAVRHFDTRAVLTEELYKGKPAGQTLHLKSINAPEKGTFPIRLGDLAVRNKEVIIERMPLEIGKSPDDQFLMVLNRQSQGADEQEASSNARDVNWAFSSTGDTLSLADYFRIDTDRKLRAQKLTLKLLIPEGASVAFDGKWGAFRIYSDLPGENLYHLDLAGKSFTLTPEGLQETKQSPAPTDPTKDKR